MKIKTQVSLIAAGSFLLTSLVFAESMTFSNNLQSKILVSPAQLNQVKGARTDLSIGFDSGSQEVKTDLAKKTTDTTGSNFNATGIYSMATTGVKAGLDVKYDTLTNDPKNAQKYDETQTQIAPMALYTWDMITVAAKYNFISQTREKLTATDKNLDTTYAIFTPAVLVSQQSWEGGLVYASPVNKAESDELAVTVPAKVTLHGRYAVMPEMKVGASVAQVNWNAISEETLKDQTVATANLEWEMNQLALEGLVSYATANYDGNKNFGAPNTEIPTWGVEAAADYNLAKTASVGGAVGYTTGSDKVSGVEVNKNDLALSVRGNLMF